MPGKNCRSGVGVARVLGVEGFTPFVASLVRKWYRRRIASRHQRARYDNARTAFREMVKVKLSAGDRIIMGKFISQIEVAAFHTGLRMGLAVRMADAEPWEPDHDSDRNGLDIRTSE